MTVQRICQRHGAYTAKRCPACKQDRATRPKPPTEANRIRSTTSWKRAAARTLARDGHRCTYGGMLGEHYWQGGRCPVTVELDAHHITPIEDGGAPFDDANLRTLCATHHARVEAELRQAKAEAR